MTSAHCPALFAALLVLGACAKSDEGSTDTDSAAQTSAAQTSAAQSTGATTSATGAAETSSGEGTTHASHGESTGTDSGSTAAPTTGEGTTGGALVCEAYCATIGAHCTGEHAQYGSTETCLATCAAFPPGTLADTGGNTLGCRNYHAGAAAGMPEIHCTHAGPGGDGVCGDNCESFCTLAAAVCPDAWPDDAACQTACGTFSPDEPYDATDVGGNTFACRLYHLTAAALDPVTHCGHIKGNSAPCM